MQNHFKPKRLFSPEHYELPSFPKASHSWRLPWARLATGSSRNAHLVRAMIALNDLQTIGYLNWKTMRDADQIYTEGVLGDGGPEPSYQLMIMHRRWLFRMGSICVSDTLKLLPDLEANFALIWQKDDVQSRFKAFELIYSKGERKWIEALRNHAGAHIDPKVLAKAIQKMYATDNSASSKLEMSTSMFASRYWIADEILTAGTFNTAWNLVGSQEAQERSAEPIAVWFGELQVAIHNLLITFCERASHEC